MSPKLSEKHAKRMLKKLVSRKENERCADCSTLRPRWASIIAPPPNAPAGSGKIGLFCCFHCSEAHRSLGTHIAFVKSVSLNEWTESDLAVMERGGNLRVNALFEGGHFSNKKTMFMHSLTKPTPDVDDPMVRLRFIRDKYVRLKYFLPGSYAHVFDSEAGQSGYHDGLLDDICAFPSSNMPHSPFNDNKRNTSSRKLCSSPSDTCNIPKPILRPSSFIDRKDSDPRGIRRRDELRRGGSLLEIRSVKFMSKRKDSKGRSNRQLGAGNSQNSSHCRLHPRQKTTTNSISPSTQAPISLDTFSEAKANQNKIPMFKRTRSISILLDADDKMDTATQDTRIARNYLRSQSCRTLVSPEINQKDIEGTNDPRLDLAQRRSIMEVVSEVPANRNRMRLLRRAVSVSSISAGHTNRSTKRKG